MRFFFYPDGSHGIDHNMMAMTTNIAAVARMSPRSLFIGFI